MNAVMDSCSHSLHECWGFCVNIQLVILSAWMFRFLSKDLFYFCAVHFSKKGWCGIFPRAAKICTSCSSWVSELEQIGAAMPNSLNKSSSWWQDYSCIILASSEYVKCSVKHFAEQSCCSKILLICEMFSLLVTQQMVLQMVSCLLDDGEQPVVWLLGYLNFSKEQMVLLVCSMDNSKTIFIQQKKRRRCYNRQQK